MSEEIGLGRVRQLWHLQEPLHAVFYYAPEAFDEAAALGYKTDEMNGGRVTSPGGPRRWVRRARSW